jgi:flagellar biosynthesis anti-sigma factor FlgM
MKIEGITQAAVTPLPTDSVQARVQQEGPAAAQSPQGDWTSFHSDSTSVQSLTTQALQSPEVRQPTVDALRQSVASGQYQVDTAKVANAISIGYSE